MKPVLSRSVSTSSSVRRGAAFAAILLAGVACTKTGSSTQNTSPPATTSSAPPTTTAPPTQSESPTATPSPVLEDGRSFVYVKTLANLDTTPNVTFDLAIFLTGDAANAAAAARGDEVPVPNDVYIINDNPKLRTLDVSPDVKVYVYDWMLCCDSTPQVTFAAWAGHVANPTTRWHGTTSPYWITVKGGVIVKIEEQYLP